jgi:hypothetical protein
LWIILYNKFERCQNGLVVTGTRMVSATTPVQYAPGTFFQQPIGCPTAQTVPVLNIYSLKNAKGSLTTSPYITKSGVLVHCLILVRFKPQPRAPGTAVPAFQSPRPILHSLSRELDAQVRQTCAKSWEGGGGGGCHIQDSAFREQVMLGFFSRVCQLTGTRRFQGSQCDLRSH